MTRPPTGTNPIVWGIYLADVIDQSRGGPGFVDRVDEKFIRYIKSAGESGGRYPRQYWDRSRYSDHTGRRRSRGRGGPSRRYPTHHSRYRQGRPRGAHRKYWSRSGRRRRKGYYYSYKHKRWLKSKWSR